MGLLQDLFGTKPIVPKMPTLDLGAEQQKAIGDNTAALPGMERLVGKANQFSRDEITRMLESTIPGYSKMVSSATGTIASEMAGQIPGDVSAAVQDSAAAKALGGGYAGSGAHGDLVARDLGLTSLDLTQKGLSSFEDWTKMSASLYEPSQINVSSMFITPQQTAAFDEQQNENQFQQQWMTNQIRAEPDPTTVGIFNLATGVVDKAVGAVAGGGGGGGGL
jgi:hypothetical protein